MAYKNAGIKDIREAVDRVMNGDDLYTADGDKIVFKEDRYISFLFVHKNEFIPLKLSSFKDWQVKTYWRDNVSAENPVLCWLGRVGIHQGLIIGYSKKDGTHVSTHGGHWLDATPVKLSEIKQYIIEE